MCPTAYIEPPHVRAASRASESDSLGQSVRFTGSEARRVLIFNRSYAQNLVILGESRKTETLDRTEPCTGCLLQLGPWCQTQ